MTDRDTDILINLAYMIGYEDALHGRRLCRARARREAKKKLQEIKDFNDKKGQEDD